MSKVRSIFRCAECGGSSPKWAGRCPSCGEWNTLVEELDVPTPVALAPAAPPSTGRSRSPRSTPTSGRPAPRGSARSTGCWAAASCPGRSPCVGGEPGIGKSTLLLQVASAMATRRGHGALRVRRGVASSRCGCGPSAWARSRPVCTWPARRRCPHLVAHLDEIRPDLLVVDSIQTVLRPRAVVGTRVGRPGARVRAAAWSARPRPGRCATVLVGHVTKDGGLAGPRVLEHVVDTVLSFEGERHHALRLLRAVQAPLRLDRRARPVRDDRDRSGRRARRQRAVPGRPPARRVRARSWCPPSRAIARCSSRSRRWSSPTILALPRRSAQGLDAGRLSLLLAVLAPAGGHPGRPGRRLRAGRRWRAWCAEPGADLGVALAIASAGSGRPLPADVVVCGEVGLGGELRQVAQTRAATGRGGPAGLHRGHRPPVSAPEPPPGITALRADDLARRHRPGRVGLGASPSEPPPRLVAVGPNPFP